MAAVRLAVSYFDGSPSRMARAIGPGVKRQNVEHWLRTDRVPAEHCAALESAVHGVVRRWDLRPDDWHVIWPELVGTDGAPELAAPEQREAA